MYGGPTSLPYNDSSLHPTSTSPVKKLSWLKCGNASGTGGYVWCPNGEAWLNMCEIVSGAVQTVLDSSLLIPNMAQCKCECMSFPFTPLVLIMLDHYLLPLLATNGSWLPSVHIQTFNRLFQFQTNRQLLQHEFYLTQYFCNMGSQQSYRVIKGANGLMQC